MSDLARWVQESSGQASVRDIAKQMRKSPDTIARWLRSGKMPAEEIIRFSRIYHADMLQGVLVGGVAEVHDVEAAMPQLLRYATAVQLTAELHRRAGGRTFRTVAS